MTFFFLCHYTANELFQFLIACASLHLRVQVMIPDREEAGSDLAITGDADSAAMSAKRMRNRRDDSDFTNAIEKSIAARCF